MLVAQPTLEVPEAPYAAVVARPLSVWPFATRTLRLFLLIDPSLPDPTPRHGLLRAMQQAYFCSDGFSQTRAVREAALAAHYVLRHHNRDVLPLLHVNAATAVAAVRGDVAFVALAGDAAVFAWRDGVLTGQRGILRLPRPLGLEQDPRITLWSTRLAPGDRLLLVCGAAWQPDSQRLIHDVCRDVGVNHDDVLERRLVSALSGSRPAGVLVVDPEVSLRPERHLALVSTRETGHPAPPLPPAQAAKLGASGGPIQVALRWASRLLAIVLLGAAALAALNSSPDLPRMASFHQAQALLAQADETSDPYQAHALTASALELLQSGTSGGPPQEEAALVARATSKLEAIDRVYRVWPEMAVRLGPSGANVVDLSIGEDTLYTLDVVEGTVREFALDARDQQPTPDTLLVRAGAPIGSGARPLAIPVAIQYLSGAQPDQGVLAIIDQARTVVQVGRDRTLSQRPVASSASWRELGALGSDNEGNLYVLDSGSRRLLEYTSLGQRPVDAPRLLLDDTLAPDLAFDRAAEIVPQQDDVYLRMDDGTLRHFDAQGRQKQFAVRPPDGAPSSVSAVAPDRSGGLYLVDTANARILQTTADGTVLRQLRDPALAGVRQIRSSLDGRRLYGLVTSGILVFDVPQSGSV
ncbi:MAG: hypothetical protein M3069_10115 [Chloroflexota bacterium]|nr:hypothetical protein [Chloroflexota bacterium]